MRFFNIRCIMLFFMLATGFIFFLFFPRASIAKAEDIYEYPFKAKAIVLGEPYSGNILFAKNEDKKIYPASITKLMTVLIVFEELDKASITLKHDVVVSKRASSMGGSELFLSEGDKVSVEELLIGIIVGSANDAAVAIAEHIAGSEESFVKLMNRRAKELNMDNTNFANATGFHSDNHYSTAKDIFKLSKAVLDYPSYHKWATIWMDEHFLKGKIKSGEVYLSNTNRLILDFPGCDGLKTGFTDEAGYCLASTAYKNDTRFISVVTASPSFKDLYEESKLLLNYALNNYKSICIIDKHTVVEELIIEKATQNKLPIMTKQAFYLLLPKDKEPEIKKEIYYHEPLSLPVAEGEIVGSLNIIDDNKRKGSVKLLATISVDRARYFQLLGRYFKIWLQFGR